MPRDPTSTDALSKLRELIDLNVGHTPPYHDADKLVCCDSCPRCRMEALLLELEQQPEQCESCEDWKRNYMSASRRGFELIKRERELRESLEWIDREWQIFYKHLPDGEYEGLGMLRASLRAALGPEGEKR